jgi:hypothetical protein
LKRTHDDESAVARTELDELVLEFGSVFGSGLNSREKSRDKGREARRRSLFQTELFPAEWPFLQH